MTRKNLNAKMLRSILKDIFDQDLVYPGDLSISVRKYLNFYDFKGRDPQNYSLLRTTFKQQEAY